MPRPFILLLKGRSNIYPQKDEILESSFYREKILHLCVLVHREKYYLIFCGGDRVQKDSLKKKKIL